jgi:16S rRNA processing protein RimM
MARASSPAGSGRPKPAGSAASAKAAPPGPAAGGPGRFPPADPSLISVGRIARAHGIRGELAVELRTDDPEDRFAPGALLRTNAPERPTLEVVSARPHSGRLLVTFAGIADRTAAEALQGALLLIGEDEVGDAGDDAWWDHDLVGLTAVDAGGSVIGEVAEVIHTPGGVLLAVRAPQGREHLVPFVEEIVSAVDVSTGRLVVDAPPGLLDL